MLIISEHRRWRQKDQGFTVIPGSSSLVPVYRLSQKTKPNNLLKIKELMILNKSTVLIKLYIYIIWWEYKKQNRPYLLCLIPRSPCCPIQTMSEYDILLLKSSFPAMTTIQCKALNSLFRNPSLKKTKKTKQKTKKIQCVDWVGLLNQGSCTELRTLKAWSHSHIIGSVAAVAAHILPLL